MDGRWQADDGMSPKSQDADIENVGMTNHSHSPKLEGVFILISNLQRGSRPAIFTISPRRPAELSIFRTIPLAKGDERGI